MQSLLRFFAFNLLCFLLFTSITFSQYQFVRTIGTSGNGNSQFSSPNSITIDSLGYLYITDQNNHRVQKFDSSGQFILTFGEYGSYNGKFITPMGICHSSDKIFVVDYDNARVQAFNYTGEYISRWSAYAVDVARNNSGMFYITNNVSNSVNAYNSIGNKLYEWGEYGAENSRFINPEGICVDKNNCVYVADRGNNRIQIFNSSGDFIAKFGTYGTGNGEFNSPADVAVDSIGNIFVVDAGNNRIQKFDASLAYVCKWGGTGSSNGLFNNPKGIAIAPNGNIWVVDVGNNRIQGFCYNSLHFINTGDVSKAICAGDSVYLNFIAPNAFDDDNTFSAILSASDGNFSQPTIIGTLNATTGGTIPCKIPTEAASGTRYRIKVIASNPEITGSDNGSDLTIHALPSTNFLSYPHNICQGVTNNLYSINKYSSNEWLISGEQGTDYILENGGGTNDSMAVITWLTEGTKTVSVRATNSAGCLGVAICTTIVQPRPIPQFKQKVESVPQNSSGNLYSVESYNAYNWSVSGENGEDYKIESGGTNLDSTITLKWLTSGTRTVSVTVMDSNSCVGSAECQVLISGDISPSFIKETPEICQETSGSEYVMPFGFQSYTWTISGTKSQDYTIESGGTKYDSSITIQWLTSGNKSIAATVKDEFARVGTAISHVCVHSLPNTALILSSKKICAGGVSIINSKNKFPTNQWKIISNGDPDYSILEGGTSSDSSITILWKNSGNKTISLVFSDSNQCSNQVQCTIEVMSLPQVLIYGMSSVCGNTQYQYTTPSDSGINSKWLAINGKIDSSNNFACWVKWDNSSCGYLKLIKSNSSCKDSSELPVLINYSPEVTLENFYSVCQSSEEFVLSGGKPEGGFYSGNGVVAGVFYPQNANIGKNAITYTFTNNNNCSASATKYITVFQNPDQPTIQQNENTLASSAESGNQWFLNGSAILNANGQFYNATSDGFYQVQVTDYNGCRSEKSELYNFKYTGVDDFLSGISISPNPNNGILRIHANTEQFCSISLVDMLGRNYLCDIEKISSNEAVANIEFLPNGVYLLLLQSRTGTVFSTIIMKE